MGLFCHLERGKQLHWEAFVSPFGYKLLAQQLSPEEFADS
jgi:hypothetical protein